MSEKLNDEDLAQALKTLKDNGFDCIKPYRTYSPKIDLSNFQEYITKQADKT